MTNASWGSSVLDHSSIHAGSARRAPGIMTSALLHDSQSGPSTNVSKREIDQVRARIDRDRVRGRRQPVLGDARYVGPIREYRNDAALSRDEEVMRSRIEGEDIGVFAGCPVSLNSLGSHVEQKQGRAFFAGDKGAPIPAIDQQAGVSDTDCAG